FPHAGFLNHHARGSKRRIARLVIRCAQLCRPGCGGDAVAFRSPAQLQRFRFSLLRRDASGFDDRINLGPHRLWNSAASDDDPVGLEDQRTGTIRYHRPAVPGLLMIDDIGLSAEQRERHWRITDEHDVSEPVRTRSDELATVSAVKDRAVATWR